jgi:hypothetical protein
MPSINVEYTDDLIGHHLDLLRVEAHLQASSVGYLEAMADEVRLKIEEFDVAGVSAQTYRYKRQEALLRSLEKSISRAYRDIDSYLKDELLELGEFHSAAIGRITDDVFGANLMKVGVTKREIKSILSNHLVEGVPSADWWAKQSSDSVLRFSSQVRMGYGLGETNDQIVNRVIGKVSGPPRRIRVGDKIRRIYPRSGGVLDVSKNDAKKLVRTSVQGISGDVALKTYQENAHILRGVLAVTTLDLRTSDICKARTGALWDIETGKPLPESPYKKEDFPGPTPWHWQCRTFLAPQTKSWEELAGQKGIPEPELDARASMDGVIASPGSFDDFLKRKTTADQIESLGPGKYRLWKEGKITTRDLIDQAGNPRTVKELEALARRREAQKKYYRKKKAEKPTVEAPTKPKKKTFILSQNMTNQKLARTLQEKYSLPNKEEGSLLVRFTGLDQGMAFDMATALDETLTDFPILLRAGDRFNVKTFASSTMKKSVMDWTSSINRVRMNREWFADAEKVFIKAAKNERVGWWPLGVSEKPGKFIMNHELGHALHEAIEVLENSVDLDYRRFAGKFWGTIERAYADKKAVLQLSEYASKSPHEFIAETFAQYQSVHKSLWSPFTKEFAGLMDEFKALLKKKGHNVPWKFKSEFRSLRGRGWRGINEPGNPGVFKARGKAHKDFLEKMMKKEEAAKPPPPKPKPKPKPEPKKDLEPKPFYRTGITNEMDREKFIEYMKEKYKSFDEGVEITVGKSVDDTLLREMLKISDEVFEDFPLILSKDELFHIMSLDPKFMRTGRMMAIYDSNAIVMDRGYWKNLDEVIAAYRAAAKKKWFPEGAWRNPPRATMAHELGHSVHYALFEDALGKGYTGPAPLKKLARELRTFIDKAFKDKNLVLELSEYASKSKNELFAELFSQYRTTPPSEWSPLTRRFSVYMEELRDLLKEMDWKPFSRNISGKVRGWRIDKKTGSPK